jgi:type VI secretion system protein ImpH
MAGTDRAEADRVEFFSALAERPFEFDFYHALRRVETLFRAGPRIGRSLRPADDPVRLAQEPSLAFAPATLASFKASKTGGKPRLAVAFGGLFGPQGPLPLHLTEYARDRIINSADPTFARFLDIFHHRMLSLVYRAWADAQPTVQFDRPESDRFAAYVGSLAGFGQPSLLRRDAMPDLAKLYFAGRFVCHARHAEGLQAVLSEFFQLPMKLVEFVGRWLRLPEDCRCVLGDGTTDTALGAVGNALRGVPGTIVGIPPGGATTALAQLGVSATIGEYVWDCQTKFRIVAGPMNFTDYQRLLPGGASLARLEAIVKNYVGLELDWDLHLVLEEREVPMAQLGSLGQLGWTTWLISEPRQGDAADLVLSPQAA